jgi:hypothetical protein
MVQDRLVKSSQVKWIAHFALDLLPQSIKRGSADEIRGELT